MVARKVNDALEGHVDVKDAYRMAHDDVVSLCKMLDLETRMHARHAQNYRLIAKDGPSRLP